MSIDRCPTCGHMHPGRIGVSMCGCKDCFLIWTTIPRDLLAPNTRQTQRVGVQGMTSHLLEELLSALRNQGLLQNTASGVIWHVHDCPASFNFAECNYRCRVAREAFALAGTEPYVSEETRRDTEVYE